jgi:deoxyribodipyrimidine photo-lyase
MSAAAGDPSREAGLRRLHDFVHRAGPQYAKSRNFDFGPQRRGNVSVLSPYLRHRLVLEREVLEAVLQHHSASAAGKFVQEVFWRTYFKGWLEQRPSVWAHYRRSVARLLQTLDGDAEMLQRYEAAIEGNTGIDCFDAWARELTTHGYLHNHARMWFASIWVFTLHLPWQLGADFFYRHLADGDPAANTLGWRWVCGLHTPGKTYLARPSNIAHFSDNRFSPEGQLATRAPALTENVAHSVAPLPAAPTPEPGQRYGLLVTEEDCSAESLSVGGPPVAVLGALATNLRSPLPVGEVARHFSEGAVREAVDRASRDFAVHGSLSNTEDWSELLLDWASKHHVTSIVTAHGPVGPVAELLDDASEKLAARGVSVVRLRRHYDVVTWPYARRGFFRLSKAIPSILEKLGLHSDGNRLRQKAS